MKEKPFALEFHGGVLTWEHFNQEYLTEFGGLVTIECSALVFYSNR